MSPKTTIMAIGSFGRRAMRASWVLAICAAPALFSPAAGAASNELDLDGLTAVSDSRLSEMRGGFRLGGMDISFGVVIETVINQGAAVGSAVLRTAFNADSVGGPIVTLNGTPASIGDASGDFQLKQAADGGFLLTNNNGTNVLHQLGNAGGGIVAAISNSLNGQQFQQQAQLNVGIKNLNTIMGLSMIGSMLTRMGVEATGHAPGF